ncbi:PREDICTED: putative succinate dehydrogenase [ubiquinone] cytochrome b small subunit, mitochondrial [Ceratosolen solmsi marchali]|uniref:Succinate dehydrogenase [ubiquinone] cytochrome b small subunit n=1 Tax=Ceratosolen solmsi marchali TaxID=326594 RepID=A0AAJ7E020_9HYME|nr:PREDICTED: putative succinate dehydrogenase [ubiquinone] cytochrome b small subunit, mitochondrial [Ceratosolen solmsi marchali]
MNYLNIWQRFFKFTTLRSLLLLRKQGNINGLRCYSIKSITRTYSEPSDIISKPIFSKNCPCLSSLKLTKVIRNNLIQKRFHITHDGNHVKTWKLERILSATLVPLLPLCLIFENPILDTTLALVSVIHIHWGIEAIIIDYASTGSHILRKVYFSLLYVASVFTFAGLIVLIFNGPGISKVIKDGWAIKNNK